VAGLLEDGPSRAALAAAGRARARTFTWERTARETLAVVEDRARGGAGGVV
jgi:glycosyltransferase involved in cell wall biosynthesis